MAYPDSRYGVPMMGLAILAIVFGVLILAFPALVAWLVGVALIVVGILALVGSFGGAAMMTRGSRYAPPPRL